jgi:biotin synthase
MDLRKYIDGDVSRSQALELSKLSGAKLMELFSVANEIREKYCGNDIALCTITNARSGKCGEDCKFCAQSAHYNTNIESYELKEEETLREEYKMSKEFGSSKFGIVTSGRTIKKGSPEYGKLKKFIEEASKSGEGVELCASIGLLDYDEIVELKEAGLARIHNNLQTSVSAYNKIVATTHRVEDRIETIKNALRAGIDVCSGGIIGMGETWEDRIDMAFTLKELGVDSIPINILNPIPGTPYGDREILSVDEILKTIAIYRLINKDKVIKVAAGRETILKDFMGMAFMSGANGMLIGGYLTVRGRSVEEDLKFVENLKKMWEK